ncbi:DUF4145 domain-containing protein [Rhodomicrobium sp.]|uniref:DUF4145 domain-containing protein n=1 Tax=Rhodomicrobium sp. TaxID=2720632 RepID=UPI0039E2E5A6
MQANYVAPSLGRKSFNCPHCGAFSDQKWFGAIPYKTNPERDHFISIATSKLGMRLANSKEENSSFNLIENFYISQCASCDDLGFWRTDQLVYPNQRYGIAPNPEMPQDIKADFEEARSILNASPRGAAALLRLCVQKLCNHKLGKQLGINEAIAELVKHDLRPDIQKALDVVRVIGNEAVHPGLMNIKDDRETAAVLFELVNIIVEDLLYRPKQIDELYAKLPSAKTEAIADRDRKSLKKA